MKPTATPVTTRSLFSLQLVSLYRILSLPSPPARHPEASSAVKRSFRQSGRGRRQLLADDI
ncbi:hypothetical protein GUITHDRAFT_152787 [Guillardia theta CCMP2712]|uniref:Uncharacterized protein n=1 Tax=Guillardia theta (strain CCMP2712) TaxID=905079 RepID=L1JB28_GUITC|nr:hypothetical protein GUITHDRAFT_152787 [Guillardia theta CCMP2712]EKX45299.1 hypothetical protein GUITHDRAFT_152787 [Guillardia theta CCMP2712]|eukprot:XP_005832279.1 hypothetical protein GUITHDRAFT_152787 [Guillardia theta CCMP2712]